MEGPGPGPEEPAGGAARKNPFFGEERSMLKEQIVAACMVLLFRAPERDRRKPARR